jgi:hypothetical protein
LNIHPDLLHVLINPPKGKNEFFRLYESAKRDPAWFHMMLKASESGNVPMNVAQPRRSANIGRTTSCQTSGFMSANSSRTTWT